MDDTYLSKKGLKCPTCKSNRVVLVFITAEKIWEMIKKAEIKMISISEKRDVQWLCKNCFDVGIIEDKKFVSLK